jgi:hypothetical protein
MEDEVILGKDLSKVKPGDDCPYGDGGKFELRKAADPRRVFVCCSANDDHWRWDRRGKAGVARSATV